MALKGLAGVELVDLIELEGVKVGVVLLGEGSDFRWRERVGDPQERYLVRVVAEQDGGH